MNQAVDSTATDQGGGSKRNFILQQGFEDPIPQQCPVEFSALSFQPRIVAVILFVGILLHSPLYFLAFAGLLWWGAAFPRLNVFEVLYNATITRKIGRHKLTAAPPPRRFSQFLAGSFALSIGLTLATGHTTTAFILETLLAVAVLALAIGRFCLGSFLYHLIRGRATFACRTLPWGSGRV